MPSKKQTAATAPTPKVALIAVPAPVPASPVIEPAPKRKKPSTFVLTNLNPEDVETRYGAAPVNNAPRPFPSTSSPIPKTGLRQVTALVPNRENHFFSFVDESKRMCVSMLDSMTKRAVICQTCFWCRHEFATFPLGCPLRYVPSTMQRRCQSEITKEVYNIEQPIPEKLAGDLSVVGASAGSTIIPKAYYETDGAFCSFNCCLAFINDVAPRDSKYRDSKSLLLRMHAEVFPGAGVPKIHPAPSWRLLAAYGGFMTLAEFRTACDKYLYVDKHFTVGQVPKMATVGKIFEQIMIY